jgi:hypothetical protein
LQWRRSPKPLSEMGRASSYRTGDDHPAVPIIESSQSRRASRSSVSGTWIETVERGTDMNQSENVTFALDHTYPA